MGAWPTGAGRALGRAARPLNENPLPLSAWPSRPVPSPDAVGHIVPSRRADRHGRHRGSGRARGCEGAPAGRCELRVARWRRGSRPGWRRGARLPAENVGAEDGVINSVLQNLPGLATTSTVSARRLCGGNRGRMGSTGGGGAAAVPTAARMYSGGARTPAGRRHVAGRRRRGERRSSQGGRQGGSAQRHREGRATVSILASDAWPVRVTGRVQASGSWWTAPGLRAADGSVRNANYGSVGVDGGTLAGARGAGAAPQRGAPTPAYGGGAFPASVAVDATDRRRALIFEAHPKNGFAILRTTHEGGEEGSGWPPPPKRLYGKETGVCDQGSPRSSPNYFPTAEVSNTGRAVVTVDGPDLASRALRPPPEGVAARTPRHLPRCRR